MTNYTKTTDFAAKDSLPSGDSGKIIRGSEFETEFDNIATAVNSKADSANPTFTGTVTIDGLTVNGNTILGNAATDTVTVTADIASNLIPSADDTYNLGASGAEWNDLFIDGTANIDSLVADTADINGGTIDGVTIGGSSAGAITGTAISGTSFASTGNMTFGDNDKAIFGAGSDLQIYHDGTDSLVRNTTGNLYIQDDNGNIFLRPKSGQSGLTLAADGATTLFYAGSSKLATTSTGVDVTGTVTADGLTLGNAQYVKLSDTTTDSPRVLGMNSANTTYVGPVDSYDGGGIIYGASSNVNAQSFLTSGNNRLVIGSGGDVSFYEDTGTTAKFFWDASAERLGIGTSSPVYALDVAKDSAAGLLVKNTGAGSLSGMLLYNGTTTNQIYSWGATSSTAKPLSFLLGTTEHMRIDASGNVGIGTSSPAFALDVNSGTTDYAMRIQSTDSTAYIAYQDDSTSTSTTVFNGAIGDAWAANGGNAIRLLIGLNEKARIDSSGNLLVGKTATGLTTVGTEARANGIFAATRDGDPVMYVTRKTSDGAVALFYKDTTQVGVIGTVSGDLSVGSGDTALRFNSGGDSILPATSTGPASRDDAVSLGNSLARFKDLYLSGGAYLGGVAAANKLDDYEEGTWIPEIADASTGGNVASAGSVVGRYTKVGRLVTVDCYINNINTTGLTASNHVYIRDLPFTSQGATLAVGAVETVNVAFTGALVARVDASASFVRLIESNSGAGSSAVVVSDLTSGSADMTFTVTYMTT